MAQQGLDVHQLRPGVEQVRCVSMAQLVGGNLLLDAGLLEHPPQVSAGRCEDIGFWSGARSTSSNRGFCRLAPFVELPVGGVGHGAWGGAVFRAGASETPRLSRSRGRAGFKTVLEKGFKRRF